MRGTQTDRREYQREQKAEWYKRPENRERVRAYQAARYADPEIRERQRLSARQRRFGITPEEYDARLREQNFRCAVCSSDDPAGKGDCFAVDHDHGKEHVRGLLCGRCNTGLGLFRDNPELLMKATDYLLKDNLKKHG